MSLTAVADEPEEEFPYCLMCGQELDELDYTDLCEDCQMELDLGLLDWDEEEED